MHKIEFVCDLGGPLGWFIDSDLPPHPGSGASGSPFQNNLSADDCIVSHWQWQVTWPASNSDGQTIYET